MFAATRSLSDMNGDEILYADPVAMQLLDGAYNPPSLGNLGAFVEARGLGFAFTAAGVAKAAPIVIDTITRLFGSHPSEDVTNPIHAIVDALPPEAVNARKGSDGWWYDLADGHRLTHEEADARKNQVVAETIGCHVGPDGWWYDNETGQQVSHQDAWLRYQRYLNPSAAPVTSGTPFSPIHPLPFPAPTSDGGGTKIAGMSGGTIALAVGAAVLLTVLSRRK